ncbi:MAG: OmpH family outer membrane protein [Bacteroidales bacterium]|nr:OmpH family outer membrane protein [Bacteroidales bacterium]
MKKILLFTALLLGVTFFANAQKVVFLDTEYILKNIPAYKEAQEQLNKLSAEWEKEITTKYDELEKLYNQYQVDKLLLSNEMKARRENEIVSKEKEVKTLQQKRFGTDGDLFKKEQELIKPIQDEVYNAIKDVSVAESYGLVFDAASSATTLLYTDSKLDISDNILKKLGYIK